MWTVEIKTKPNLNNNGIQAVNKMKSFIWENLKVQFCDNNWCLLRAFGEDVNYFFAQCTEYHQGKYSSRNIITFQATEVI